jgi:hypothetical protein
VTRHRFVGAIAGVGSTSGTRVVVGRWRESPFGPFADAMVETASGHRVLVAPTREVADYIAATYSFDEIRVEDVAVTGPDAVWQVTSRSLTLTLGVGDRTFLGRLLALVPAPVATHPAWASAADPFSRVVMRGVRTRGTAVAGRREWYGATEVRAVVRMRGRFDGADLGALAPVDPPCRFGFSSTPRRPSVTAVVTTVDV